MDLSVVIPTVGRPRELTRTLNVLERQRGAPDEVEVIVVDYPDDEQTAQVTDGRGPRFRRITRQAYGVAAGRNAGWRAARARVIVFLGDDCMPEPDVLARHAAFHAEHPADEDALLGRVRWARELRVTAFMRWLEVNIQFDFDRIEGREAGWGDFYTANVSVKRALLERVGGFDEAFLNAYEDLETGYRMHAAGMRLSYDPDAVAEHLHRPTVAEYERRMTRIAVAERQLIAKHPELRPWFHNLLSHAAASPPARGRGARLAALVPRSMPWLGEKVWTSADMYFGQRLARPFLAAWEEAEEADQPAEAASRSSSGSPPGGPK